MVKIIIFLVFAFGTINAHAGIAVSFDQGLVKVYLPDGVVFFAMNGDTLPRGSRISYHTYQTIHLRYAEHFDMYLKGKGELTVIDYNFGYSKFYLKYGNVKVRTKNGHVLFLDSNGVTVNTLKDSE
jgi:hypothetical protein